MKFNPHAQKLLVVFFALVVVVGCVAIAINLITPRSFYDDHGDWGIAYIPLIEPYRVTKLFGRTVKGEERKWAVDLIVPPDQKELYYYLYISDVTRVSVEKEVIMVYSQKSNNITEAEKKIGQKLLYWFVIVPSQQIETGFETEDEFKSYIYAFGITDPDWVDVETAWQDILQTGCLDWFPDCK